MTGPRRVNKPLVADIALAIIWCAMVLLLWNYPHPNPKENQDATASHQH